MPAATALSIREQVVKRHQAGESLARISRELGVAYETARKLWRHYRQTGRLEPSYDRCRPAAVRKAAAVYAQALTLKQQHPTWGGGLIWVELAEQFEETQLPSVRTLQRWFRRTGLTAPPPHVHARRVARGQRVHQVWALDAKEQVRFADGSAGSWLTISDEASGAILQAQLFPLPPLDAGGTAAGARVLAASDGALGLPGGDPRGQR